MYSNIVLVCIGNFQKYILQNIKQLLRLGQKNIFILTEHMFFKEFEEFENKIILINIAGLDELYQYNNVTQLDREFRNGFWLFTSLRFFYIYEFMKKYSIENVIHIENDVLLYYNCDSIINMFDNRYIYVPFDTLYRNIASILYVPNHSVLKHALDKYDNTKNDMENFYIIKNNIGIINNFPIFPTSTINEEHIFVTQNYELFNNIIFDAAAMGQYLGGVDPRNSSIDSIGFVNETCIIKYNNYLFVWEEIDEIKRPFIIVDNKKIPIFNLHIHSKNLNAFI